MSAPPSEHRTLRDRHIHDRFGTLLGLLVACFLLSGLTEFGWARGLVGLLQIVVLCVAYLSTRTKGRFPVLAVLLVVGFTASCLTVAAHADLRQVHGVVAAIGFVLYLAILVAVLKRVMALRTVRLESILGALCAYFVIGLMFASGFAVIDSFSVAPIFGQPVPRSEYSYFSFVTLTTVGYGDIAAVSEPARRLAVVEAMVGQIFLATAIARLVSLYGAELRSANDPTSRAQDRADDQATATYGGPG